MDISITGNYNRDLLKGKNLTIHKVLKPGFKLYVGSECNDGRPIAESWRYKQAIKLGCPIIKKKPSIAPEEKRMIKKDLLVDKYSPKSLGEIIGHKEAIRQLSEWLGSWDNQVSGVVDGTSLEKRGVLITGPPGIGKTTTAHLVAASCGYKVTEYNASDTRSVAVLKGLISLGIKRLVKEVIIMDEIDGLSERGGVGELADIIRKSAVPIICIANEKPPKLRPIINACLDIKFNRPNKSTIATAMCKVAAAEGILTTKADLEELCERNGNDIRAILNGLEMGFGINGEKDALLRMDLFSATQRLLGNKRLRSEDAANLVFVDYNMVPLMVQEGYLAASRGGLEEGLKAAELISAGDVMDKRIHQRQDWSLLPHFVGTVAAAAQSVSGPAPFQIFPQWLGKNSKRLKHKRYLSEMGAKMMRTAANVRLDYAEPLQQIILGELNGSDSKTTIKTAIDKMDATRLTRENIMEELPEVLFDAVEIPTKVKTALTREYNKTHSVMTGKKRKIAEISLDSDEDSDDEDLDELEDELEHLDLE